MVFLTIMIWTAASHGPHREAASAGHCRPSDLGGGAPFVVQASPIRYWQMNAVAAIVGSWRWRWITVIYEDIDCNAQAFSFKGNLGNCY